MKVYKCSLIDTPGLVDNRKMNELSDDKILKKIEVYMKKLGQRLNVGLFCWEAKSRFSADDFIQDLLGKGVIEHLWICITQLDKFHDLEAQKIKANTLTDLPHILKKTMDLNLIKAISYFHNLSTLTRA